MPTVSLNRDHLFKALGKTYTREDFDQLCFDFGIELDDVEEVDNQIIYKIDIPANRYDLLCFEGIARGLNIFIERIPSVKYSLKPTDTPLKMIVEQSVENVRPHVVCAVLRDFTFTPERYNSFIDLQDKLHQNICRKRSLASVGTHDLDTLSPPFFYRAKTPSSIKFVPLAQTQAYSADELMNLYSTSSHLKSFLPIIKDEPLYPVIYDAKDTILSLPPIINGEHSKITLKTKNVFIEVTATNLNKANIVLDTLVTMFSEYCQEKFTIEPVCVEYWGGVEHKTPELKYRTETIIVNDVNRYLGISLHPMMIADLLKKMCLNVQFKQDNFTLLDVTIPPTRHDIIHVTDIIEDVAIAYGYNNISFTLPKTNCISQQFPLNHLTDALRNGIAAAGFTEAFTFALCSGNDLHASMEQNSFFTNDSKAVKIANPKTSDFQFVRNSLIPGLLKTISYNRRMPLPMKLFEVSDVVFPDSKKDVGARNERHCTAVYYGKTSGFEYIHGLLDRIMELLGVKSLVVEPNAKRAYRLQEVNTPMYLGGRCADVYLDDLRIGCLGVLHPNVVSYFDLALPSSSLEINIEPFL